MTGVGKSGHIGSKIAATMASTGTPAFFVHPAEANHGDLGMIAKDDAIIAMSWSGETAELKGIIAYSRRFSIPLIAITSGTESDAGAGGRMSSSTCRRRRRPAARAGADDLDAAAACHRRCDGDRVCSEMRGFTPDHFRTFHPGGQLGASLTKISDIMHTGDGIPDHPRSAPA